MTTEQAYNGWRMRRAMFARRKRTAQQRFAVPVTTAEYKRHVEVTYALAKFRQDWSI